MGCRRLAQRRDRASLRWRIQFVPGWHTGVLGTPDSMLAVWQAQQAGADHELHYKKQLLDHG